MKVLDSKEIAALHVSGKGSLSVKSSKTGTWHTYHPHKSILVKKVTIVQVESNEIIIQVRKIHGERKWRITK